MAKPLYIKASGNKITIICNSKEQEEFVIKSMSHHIVCLMSMRYGRVNKQF